MSDNVLVCFELFDFISSYENSTVTSENTLPAFTWFLYLMFCHCAVGLGSPALHGFIDTLKQFLFYRTLENFSEYSSPLILKFLMTLGHSFNI